MTDVMLAFANARAGREQAYEAWYADEHIPAVLAVEGILGARRFRAATDLKDGPDHPYVLLTAYDVVSGQLPGTVERLIAARPPMSGDAEGIPRAWCFEELGPRVGVPDTGEGPFDHVVVLTNARAGADAEFNRWYDEVHVPDVLDKIRGYVGARRFRRAEVPLNRGCPWGYMALYDVPKGEMAHCLERIQWSRAERDEALAAGRTPQVPIAPGLADEREAWFFREIVGDPAAVAGAVT
jgi:hypothetical protein